ncbi:MAG: hypothetical protein MAG795_00801 [Candidatus Woesearchaeota archaeon]|nr:hypothetical protein [Candidatus Woesearchaeota archaeon]
MKIGVLFSDMSIGGFTNIVGMTSLNPGSNKPAVLVNQIRSERKRYAAITIRYKDEEHKQESLAMQEKFQMV